MATKTNLVWNGEKIVQKVEVEDMNFTPKDILDSLDNVRGQINKMREDKEKFLENIKTIDDNIKNAHEFERERKEFETKCLEINKNKLRKLINQIHNEVFDETMIEVDKIITQDSNAYTDQQKTNQYYVLYQKKLATHKKVAKRISKRLITEHLFVKPIFENPFK